MKCDVVYVCLVIDEYGGIFGFVILEDLIEEFVGEIFDEYDLVFVEFVDFGDGCYCVSV